VGPNRKKIYTLFGERKKRNILLLFFLFTIISLFELISVGFIYPFLAILVDFENFSSNYSYYLEILNLNNQREVILFAGFFMVFVYLFKFFLLLYVNWWKLRIVFKRNASLKSSLMTRYMGMSYRNYISGDSSRYIHTGTAAVDKYTGVLESCINLTSNFFMMIGILVVLVYLNGILLISAGVLVFSLVYFFDVFFKKKLNQLSEGMFSSSVDLIKGITEGVRGLKEIRILGKESFFVEDVNRNALIYSKHQITNNLINVQPKYFYELLVIVIFTVAIMVNTELSTGFKDYIPTLGVLIFAVMRLLPSLNIMTSCVSVIRNGEYAVNMIHQDYFALKTTEELNLKDNFLKFKALELKNIFFSYNLNSKYQLRDINFQLNANDSIGIYGKSGSGKTTLVDILLGLLEPSQGTVFLNGKEIPKDTVTKNTQDIFAYIPQDIFIYNGSIKENITLNEKENQINEDLLQNAVISSQLEEVIEGLDEGINSNIGERGIKLSGGQKQRIAIARALYHRRQVLIMDEATSALDDGTEFEVIEEIKRIRGKTTLIVIAHRLTTLRYCNKIFEIDNGEISEEKTYDEISTK